MTYAFESGWFRYLCLKYPGQVYLRQLADKSVEIVVENEEQQHERKENSSG